MHPLLHRALLTSLLLLAPAAHAITKTTSASGDWATNGNWVGGSFANVGGSSTLTPGVDSAIVNGHAMTISASYPNTDLNISGGQFVRIQGGGSLGQVGGRTNHIRIADSSDGTLDIQAGTFNLNDGGQLRVGLAGGTGTVIVGDGVGAANSAVLNLNNKENNWATIGDRASTGHASLTVNSDGLVALGGSIKRFGQNGNMAVTLNGGTMTASGNIEFASGGTANSTLVMSNGSLITQTSGDFYFGYNGVAQGTMNGNAQINHTPGNWFWLSRDNGTSTLTLNDTAKITSNAGNFQIGADYHGGGGDATPARGTLNVNDNAFVDHVNAGAGFRLGWAQSGHGTVNQTSGTVRTAGIGEIGRAGNGTYNLSGGSFVVNGSTLTVGVTANGRGTVNQDGGVLQAFTLNLGSGGSTGGTYHLEGGSLRVNTVNVNASNSAFHWTGGTILNHTPNVMNTAGGVTDYTLGSPSLGVVFRSGDTIAFNGSLNTTAATGPTTLDLGGLYLNSGPRTDILNLTGSLNLGGSADTLLWDDNSVYYLRPFGFFSEDYGSVPLVSAASITGSLETFVPLTDDGRGFSQFTGVFTSASALDVNTWYLEQTGTQLLFHYKVAGFVPEPGTFGLMVLGAGALRYTRRRRP